MIRDNKSQHKIICFNDTYINYNVYTYIHTYIHIYIYIYNDMYKI